MGAGLGRFDAAAAPAASVGGAFRFRGLGVALPPAAEPPGGRAPKPSRLRVDMGNLVLHTYGGRERDSKGGQCQCARFYSKGLVGEADLSRWSMRLWSRGFPRCTYRHVEQTGNGEQKTASTRFPIEEEREKKSEHATHVSTLAGVGVGPPTDSLERQTEQT